MGGTIILTMSVGNLHFLNSLYFLHMSLKNISKSIDLTCKEYYTYFFTANNLEYVGAYLEPKFYGADYNDERAQFLECYEEQKSKMFCNKQENWPTAWTMSMRQACCAFRNMVTACPFGQAITISSICNKVFRTMLPKQYTVGYYPERDAPNGRSSVCWSPSMAGVHWSDEEQY